MRPSYIHPNLALVLAPHHRLQVTPWGGPGRGCHGRPVGSPPGALVTGCSACCSSQTLVNAAAAVSFSQRSCSSQSGHCGCSSKIWKAAAAVSAGHIWGRLPWPPCLLGPRRGDGDRMWQLLQQSKLGQCGCSSRFRSMHLGTLTVHDQLLACCMPEVMLWNRVMMMMMSLKLWLDATPGC